MSQSTLQAAIPRCEMGNAEQGVSAAHATRQQQVCERRKTQDGSGRAQELKRVGGEVVGRWHRVGARRG